MLDTMGDLLEVSGADKFRCLSYHKAAHAHPRLARAALAAWPRRGGSPRSPASARSSRRRSPRSSRPGPSPSTSELKGDVHADARAADGGPRASARSARALLHDTLGVATHRGPRSASSPTADRRRARLRGQDRRRRSPRASSTRSATASGCCSWTRFPLAEPYRRGAARAARRRARASPRGACGGWEATVGDIDVVASSAETRGRA